MMDPRCGDSNRVGKEGIHTNIFKYFVDEHGFDKHHLCMLYL